MKKVVIILLIISALVLWQGIHLYVKIQADKDHGIRQLIPFMEKELGIKIVDVTRFHGDQLYIVFTCVDPEDGGYSFVFMDEQANYQQIPFQRIQVNKQMAMDLAKQKFPEITNMARVVPGLVNQQFVWEISGYDREDNLHYVYYTMETGSFVKRFTVNQLTK